MHGTTIASANTLCAAISYALMVARRTYYAVDTVIGAVENETVELVTVVGDSAAEFAQAVGTESVRVVEAVGNQGVKAVPVVSAVLLTLLLLALRNLVARLWYSRKETMKRQGETPEGNAQSMLPDRESFPYLPWLTQELMASACSNLKDGLALAANPGAIKALAGSADAFGWVVASQTGVRAYHTRVRRSSQLVEFCEPWQVSNQIECTCPG